MGESMIVSLLCLRLFLTGHDNLAKDRMFLLAIGGRSRSYNSESGLFREVGLPRETVPGYVPFLALIFYRGPR